MKTVLAIDPGPEQSGIISWCGAVRYAAVYPNNDVLTLLQAEPLPDFVAIEMVACYGMAVGKEVFETCVWIGRFTERSKRPVRLVYRHQVKMHLCHTMKAKDTNIRQALIDKHGAPGTKKAPGATYGIAGHLWAALAVADFAFDTLNP